MDYHRYSGICQYSGEILEIIFSPVNVLFYKVTFNVNTKLGGEVGKFIRQSVDIGICLGQG